MLTDFKLNLHELKFTQKRMVEKKHGNRALWPWPHLAEREADLTHRLSQTGCV